MVSGTCTNISGCFSQIHKYIEVGIVSFGPSPCDDSIPAVYTRVAGYSKWVVDTVNDNDGWG